MTYLDMSYFSESKWQNIITEIFFGIFLILLQNLSFTS